MQKRRPVMLVILDGWGWREEVADNAVRQARTPNFDRLWGTCPHPLVHTSGTDVGLPQGQMGNSEVGHLNIGAGGPCDERLAIRYQVRGRHPGEQTWIRTLYDGHQLDEAEQAAREWHEMIVGKLGSSDLADVPSNETLFAWANDLRRLRRMEFPE